MMAEQLIPIQWKDDALVLLDQTVLPNEVVYESLKRLRVFGTRFK